MESKTMSLLLSFSSRLFKFEGTHMHPNILLMCKMLVILISAHHMLFKISDPFIPFIQEFDYLNGYPNFFKYTMRFLYVSCSVLLLFNVRVKTASLIIGLVVIINIIASKPLFFNHVLICGCALFLAGLTDNKTSPNLLIYQLSLVYFGASLNKFLDPDWWSGDFMHNWLGVARENAPYLYISQYFKELVFAKSLSYITMFTEFTIAVLILFRRTRHLTILFIIIFHTILFTITSFRFGHFLESLAIVLLAFLSIPNKQLAITYRGNTVGYIKQLFQFFDLDKKQNWSKSTVKGDAWLSLKISDNVYLNHSALKKIIVYTPNFYMLLLFSDMASYIILYNHRTLLFLSNVIFIWLLIFYLVPFKQFKELSIPND